MRGLRRARRASPSPRRRGGASWPRTGSRSAPRRRGRSTPTTCEAVEAAAAGMAEAIEAAPLPADVEAALDGGLRAPRGARGRGRHAGRGALLRRGRGPRRRELRRPVRDVPVGDGRRRRCAGTCAAAGPGCSARPCSPTAPRAAGRPPASSGMAVGVQRMVVPRAAGVMFTLDPLNGDRSKIVLEGAWGLGEAVVSGEVTPGPLPRRQGHARAARPRALGQGGRVPCSTRTRARVRMAPVPPERRDGLVPRGRAGARARHARQADRAPPARAGGHRVGGRRGRRACTCCRCARRPSGAASPSSRSPGRAARACSGCWRSSWREATG